MAIGNSINTFRNLLVNNGYQTSNLYLVQIEPPPVLKVIGSEFFNMGVREIGKNRLSDLIDGMCDEVTLPSKNLNTAEHKLFGTMFRYPTGTSYSEIQLSFHVDKYAEIRYLFEKWLGAINSDVSHHVTYYKQLVSPYMTITKYEKGIEDFDNGAWKKGLFDYENVETSVYRVYNCFPFNVGSMSLSGGSSQLLKFQVSFYYERYRLMRNEANTVALQTRNNRNSFVKAKGESSDRMKQSVDITKKIIQNNAQKKKDLGLPPFNNINGANPK